jgi:hypothetical protein
MPRPDTKTMRQLVKKGQAMPPAPGTDRPGRYNIRNARELQDAIHAVGRAAGGEEGRRKVRRFIMKRAKTMGLMAKIPKNWAPDGSLKSGV